eukprot:1190465-Prorocentrum_minimum.AAC.2
MFVSSPGALKAKGRCQTSGRRRSGSTGRPSPWGECSERTHHPAEASQVRRSQRNSDVSRGTRARNRSIAHEAKGWRVTRRDLRHAEALPCIETLSLPRSNR